MIRQGHRKKLWKQYSSQKKDVKTSMKKKIWFEKLATEAEKQPVKETRQQFMTLQKHYTKINPNK